MNVKRWIAALAAVLVIEIGIGFALLLMELQEKLPRCLKVAVQRSA